MSLNEIIDGIARLRAEAKEVEWLAREASWRAAYLQRRLGYLENALEMARDEAREYADEALLRDRCEGSTATDCPPLPPAFGP